MSYKGVGFEVIIASPREYEDLIAEIYFDGGLVATVNCERGLDQLEVELPSSDELESQNCRKVDFDGFVKALSSAAEYLKSKIDT